MFKKPAHQRQIDGTLTKNAYAGDTYKGLKVAEFNIKLINNQYMNFHNVYLVFPMKIKKSYSVANDLADDVITVNNFFGHWIKELDIKRYGDDIPILPLTNTVEIYIFLKCKNILTATLYLLFEQFKLNDNYHAYLEGLMI